MSKDKNNNSINNAEQQITNYVSNMEQQPYVDAILDIQEVINNAPDPSIYSQVDINAILDNYDMGPYTDEYNW